MEYIYRDALAVAENGQTEVFIGTTPIDVVIEKENAVELVEVKYASGLRRAAGQIRDYVRRWNAENEIHATGRVHLILSPYSVDRASESRIIEEQRPYLLEDGIRLTTIKGRENVAPIYRIGQLTFHSRSGIIAEISRVKQLYSMAEYMPPEHEKFLVDLAELASRRSDRLLSSCAPRVSSSGTLVTVHGVAINLVDCVRAVVELAHFELLNTPLAA